MNEHLRQPSIKVSAAASAGPDHDSLETHPIQEVRSLPHWEAQIRVVEPVLSRIVTLLERDGYLVEGPDTSDPAPGCLVTTLTVRLRSGSNPPATLRVELSTTDRGGVSIVVPSDIGSEDSLLERLESDANRRRAEAEASEWLDAALGRLVASLVCGL